MFHVWMASLMETLVSEMVKRRDAEERMAAALERLMRWIEVTDSELDGDVSSVKYLHMALMAV